MGCTNNKIEAFTQCDHINNTNIAHNKSIMVQMSSRSTNHPDTIVMVTDRRPHYLDTIPQTDSYEYSSELKQDSKRTNESTQTFKKTEMKKTIMPPVEISQLKNSSFAVWNTKKSQIGDSMAFPDQNLVSYSINQQPRYDDLKRFLSSLHQGVPEQIAHSTIRGENVTVMIS